MFFDKSYCNSFVQKKNYLYSRRNMKCLIYKQAGDFFPILFSLKMKGDHLFSFWGLATFWQFNLWTNVLWKLRKGRGKIGLEFLILYRPANSPLQGRFKSQTQVCLCYKCSFASAPSNLRTWFEYKT